MKDKKVNPDFMKIKETKKRSAAMKAYWAKRRAEGKTKRGPYKKKGNKGWTEEKRKEQSDVMKEAFAARKGVYAAKLSVNKLSINERLNIIEHHCNAIKQQLGLGE